MTKALRWYQVMSYVVGTMLLVFCLFIVLRHGFGVAAGAEMVVAQIHGLLYMGYLVTVGFVVKDYKPRAGRIVLMVLSGIVPTMAFFVEHDTVAALCAQGPARTATP
jgi:integral membrane protein